MEKIYTYTIGGIALIFLIYMFVANVIMNFHNFIYYGAILTLTVEVIIGIIYTFLRKNDEVILQYGDFILWLVRKLLSHIQEL